MFQIRTHVLFDWSKLYKFSEINKGGFLRPGATASKLGVEKHPDEIVPVRDSHLPFTLQALLAMLSCFFSFLSVDTGGNGLRRHSREGGDGKIRRFRVVFAVKEAGDAVFSFFSFKKEQETMYLAYFNDGCTENLSITASFGMNSRKKQCF